MITSEITASEIIPVDYENLSIGVFQLMLEHPHGSCLQFGMLPNDIIKSLERNLQDTIPDYGRDKTTGKIFCDGKEFRTHIVREVCKRCVHLASKHGILVQ